MRKAVLFQLGGGDFVEQLLNQPQRTEPAADGAPQDQAIEHQNTQHIVWRTLIRGSQRVLQRPQRTGTNRPGTGVAVKAGHTHIFCVAHIDVSLDETLHMCVVEQGGVPLHEPPGGGLMGAPPCRNLLSQGRYTPYKY